MAAPLNPALKALLEPLSSQVLLPSSTGYAERELSYWSASASLGPSAILLPRSTAEVSTIIKALTATSTPFAIRSGGHTQWAGSNNIVNGVTIDLSILSTTVFHPETETVSIGPGARWKNVYDVLHANGRVVAGGREGSVGVGGLLLGGGNTFWTAHRGFGCDNCVAYEIVLASGEILDVTQASYPDLFRALKGGSNNFGIVTKFTMTAIKCDKVWGGMTFFPKTAIPDAIDALVEFTEGVDKDLDSNLVVIFAHMPEPFKDVVIATLFANMAGVEEAPAYKKWLGLPKIFGDVKMTSQRDMSFEYNIPSQMHSIWFTLSFTNTAPILAYASKLHDELVADLVAHIPEQDFITQCLFQPLPAVYGTRSASSPNIMGIEREGGNGILWLATAMMKTKEQHDYAYPKVKAWVAAVEDFARNYRSEASDESGVKGGLLDWLYLNYADPSQKVLESYGRDNVERMMQVAKKYDPEEVFQKLVPGGFKISKVEL